MSDVENTTQEQQEGQQQANNTSDSGQQTSGNSQQVSFTQEQLNVMFGERAKQAQRSLLKDLGVEDADALKSILQKHKEAEEARLAAEEAQKSEVQKLQEQIEVMKQLGVEQVKKMQTLQIRNAVIMNAPNKDVPVDRIEDLITLMDTNGVKFTDGIIDNDTVNNAIDKALEGRDYLKVKATNGSGVGSPGANAIRKPVDKNKEPLKIPTSKRKYGI